MSKYKPPGKWKPDGIARANTGGSIRGKIGPPIPMADDDEFPIRTPGAGIATPLGTGGVEQTLGYRGSTGTDRSIQQPGLAASDRSDRAHSTSIPAQSSTEEPLRRTVQPSPLRNSMASIPSGPSVEKPQRKKSSLKSVLGRLFGKKRKSGSTSSNEKEKSTSGLRADQHRSDPTALNRNPKGTSSPTKRSVSLPIVDEYNRALRSHSTVMEEFPEHNEHDQNRASIQADGQTRPRRATTPSRLWTPNKTLGYVDWTGLSPRPASSHVRDSKVITGAEAEESIGMAVTSGSHPHRRSRSLGELRRVAALPAAARRRSDEIKYWRESYDPGVLSPMSSNRAETEEPIVLPNESDHLVDPKQPQPFNFGPMGEMAGMKITQAASLETRVQRLEARMQNMEKIILRSHGGHPDVLHLQDPPKRNPSRIRSFTRPSTDNSEISLPKHDRHREARQPLQESQNIQNRSSSYSRPSTVETNASYQHSLDNFLPPAIPSPNVAHFQSQENGRPLSTSTTIRGIPSSSPTTGKDGALTMEHYTALTNMILAEQTARQQLEGVVRRLQQQLRSFNTSAPGSYLTPDSNQATNPLVQIPGGEFSSFEQDDDSSDEDGRYGTEAFQTPKEESGGYGDHTFGAVMNEDEKSAPRTMSLSQMTLGNTLQHV